MSLRMHEFLEAWPRSAKREAALARLAIATVREVRGLYANNQTLAAQIALRQADVVRMQSDVARAEDDDIVGGMHGRAVMGVRWLN